MNEGALTILADGFVFLEGPRWHDGALWFSDMWQRAVFRMTEDGACTKIVDVPGRPSGLAFLSDGTMLVVSMEDRQVMRIADGALHPYADLSALASADANDMLVDEADRLYVGHFGFDLFGGADMRQAELLYVDTRGQASVVADGMTFPNGMVLTDGGRKLVVAETFIHRLTVFDRDAQGRLSNRRIWADLGDRTPDGICIDAEGGIWIASFETCEVVRVVEGGAVTDRLDCRGEHAVACALGGADGRTLFALTYGASVEEIATLPKVGAVQVARVAVGG